MGGKGKRSKLKRIEGRKKREKKKLKRIKGQMRKPKNIKNKSKNPYSKQSKSKLPDLKKSNDYSYLNDHSISTDPDTSANHQPIKYPGRGRMVLVPAYEFAGVGKYECNGMPFCRASNGWLNQKEKKFFCELHAKMLWQYYDNEKKRNLLENYVRI